MMRPLRWARICGRTALVMRMRPKTLMLNSLWSCAREFLGGTGGADAGVVDQDVDSPEPLDHLLDHGADRLLAGHVKIEEHHTVAR